MRNAPLGSVCRSLVSAGYSLDETRIERVPFHLLRGSIPLYDFKRKPAFVRIKAVIRTVEILMNRLCKIFIMNISDYKNIKLIFCNINKIFTGGILLIKKI